jgi:subfamily B ATP-binding cassette protein MsbA
MQHLANIVRFGWPYLRRYWTRMLAGILLGVLFGLSNASFIWATQTLFERLDSKPRTEEKGSDKLAKFNFPFAEAARAAVKELKQATDEGIDPWLPRAGRGLDGRQIFGGLLFLPVLVGLRGFLGYLSTYCTSWVSYRFIRDLRVDVLAKLQSLSLAYHQRATTGDLLTRINSDTSALHRCMILGFADLTKEPVTIVFLTIGLLLVNVKLTLLILVFVPLCIIPLAVLGKKVRRANVGVTSAVVSQASLLVEAMSSIRVVKAFGMEDAQLKRYAEFNTQQVTHSMKITQAKELVNPLIETISMLGLGVLVVLIFYNQTSIPDLVGFLTGVVLLFNPIKKLGAIHVLFRETSVGVDRLAQVLAEQPTVKEPVSPKPLTAFNSAITLENVTFSYGEKPVLNEVNLTIPRGFKLGVAGESGSGKSSLVNLIFRFYDPTSGVVKLDGVDVRDVALADLRRQMALVSQEIVLFDESIAENIARGKPGATRAEIEAAARAANAHEFIQQQPQGYDTRVGERGELLSGGQRQRLAIARAFVRNAPILVLDEATSALDSQSEAEVQAAIEKLEQNRTVVCVAHRLSTLANMDRILVLSEGRIVEEGRFDELLERGGRFAAMAARQGIGGGRG